MIEMKKDQIKGAIFSLNNWILNKLKVKFDLIEFQNFCLAHHQSMKIAIKQFKRKINKNYLCELFGSCNYNKYVEALKM